MLEYHKNIIIMIDPRELRLGNWVKNKYDDLEQITLDSFDLIGKQQAVYFPIPLTARLFVKCGFLGDNNGFVHPKLTNITIKEENNDYIICDSSDTKVAIIKYVHTLQNLFFSLLIEELEIDM